MEIGKIEPIQVPADQVKPPEQEKPKKSYAWLFPSILFIALIILCLAHKDSLPVILALLLGLALSYFISIPKAIKLARAGSGVLAMKTAVGAFIPLLAAANTALYRLVNSSLFRHYLNNAKSGADIFKDWLMSISPEYGSLIYTGLIGITVIGVNVIIIKEFTKVTRALARLSGAVGPLN